MEPHGGLEGLFEDAVLLFDIPDGRRLPQRGVRLSVASLATGNSFMRLSCI